MRYERTYLRCEICGNIVGVIEDAGVELICCGEPMKQLVANTTDASTEKHVPVIVRDGDYIVVKVGSVDHPMVPEHFIEWISVAQENRTQRVTLKPGEKPEAKFCVGDGKVTVYEYCNLHGLWVADEE